MRTTLDLDDTLLSRAQAMFPAGTPKTTLIEEALRRMLAAEPPRTYSDPRIHRLVDEGRLAPATASGPPPQGPGGVPLPTLLADLASDREDR